VLIAGCGDDNDNPVDVPELPVIGSVDRTVVAPGDTITITGQRFIASTGDNRVTFNNSLGRSYPISATTSRLEVVVPSNAASGGMTVTSDGLTSEPVSIEVIHSVGEVWVVGGISLNYTIKLPDPTGLAQYLIIPHSATPTALTAGYSLEPAGTSVYPAPRANAAGRTGGTETIATRFKRNLREGAIKYLEQLGPRVKPPSPVAKSVQAPAQTRTFWVLNTPFGDPIDPNNYSSVTATLRYQGTHTLIYSDDNNPSGGFDQTDYDALGADFDGSYYPNDVAAFGEPSDINADSRVTILYTRVVNDMTPAGTAGSGFIAGFVNLTDLGPNVYPAGTTNGMEICYILVPDPSGPDGHVFSRSKVQIIARETMAHEFEHMISYGYRFVNLGGQMTLAYLQTVWLEEGMAHIAEELNGLDRGNDIRANLYLSDPGVISLMGDDTLEQRGGIWLMLRYLSDSLQDNTIFFDLLRNSYVGAGSIEAVTGEDFFTTLADFFAALYLSGRAVPHDSKYDFTTITYPAGFVPLAVTTRSVGSGPVTGQAIRNAAADFFVFENINNAALELTVRPSTSASALRVIVTRLQ
jgi:hypothetical protein